MKLLYLIHRLPCPADGGSKIRAAAQLRYLAARHDVWCAGFLETGSSSASRPGVRESLAELRSICRDVAAVPLRDSLAQVRALAGLLAGGTATESYFASAALARRVTRWSLEVGFDAVMAFSSSMAPLALRVPAARRVLDLDDLDSRKWAESADGARWPMRWVYRTEAKRLARREQSWLADFDASVLISEREAALVDDEALRRRIHVIGPSTPAHVMASRLDFDPCLPCTPLPANAIVSFIGAMNYGPNIDGAAWFGESIWPKVAAGRPDASWWLVGRSPSRVVRRLADGGRIRVTGTVPTIEPYLEQTRVAVAPLRVARGVQMKVLMAMTAGRPCVVTSAVAEGLGARPGRDLLAADSPADFAEAVLSLLNDDARARAVAAAGREFVVHQVRPQESLSRLEELLHCDAAARRERPVTTRGDIVCPCCHAGGLSL
jgi:polysaccharide biosynthesis protein PslH